MLNTYYKISKFILLFSAVVTGWTSIVLLTNSSFNLEIKQVIKNMYINQKTFILNVKDLSLILVKDANERFSERHNEINNLNNISNDNKF